MMLFKKVAMILGLSLLFTNTLFAEQLKVKENYKITSNDTLYNLDKVYYRSNQLFVPTNSLIDILDIGSIRQFQYTIEGGKYTDLTGLQDILDLELNNLGVASLELKYSRNETQREFNTISTSNNKKDNISLNITNNHLNYTVTSENIIDDFIITVTNNNNGVEVLNKLIKSNNTYKISGSILIDNLNDGSYTVRLYNKLDSSSKNYNCVNKINNLGVVDGSSKIMLSGVYNNHISKLSNTTVTDDMLEMLSTGAVKDSIIDLANTLTLDIKDNYRKSKVLYKWVTDNMYYDYDKLNSNNDTMNTISTTFNELEGVCTDYSLLYTELLKAVGIPCKIVKGYALTEQDKDFSKVNILDSNHAWVQLYVNNNWIYADPTWGSLNKVENGSRVSKGLKSFSYFDPTLEYFSLTHNIVSDFKVPTNVYQ